MFFSLGRIQASLNKLQSIHPFYGTIYLACKKGDLPVGSTIPFLISDMETEILDDFYRPDVSSSFFFRVFSISDKKKSWVKRDKYSSSTLQSMRTRGDFSKPFIHEPNSNKWGWKSDYIDILAKNLSKNLPPYRGKRIPVLDLAIWLYRGHDWDESTQEEAVILHFLNDFGIDLIEKEAIFDVGISEELYEPLFQSDPVTWKELKDVIGQPPDSRPQEGAALTFLQLTQIGPAENLRYEPSERLNIITGDNGLGKTFLLETIWWALTEEWLEYPALPRKDAAKIHPKIMFSVGENLQPSASEFNWDTQTWKPISKRNAVPGLVIYARYDGSFAVWDPARSSTLNDENPFKKHLFFKRDAIWDGLPSTDVRQKGQWLCNGLIRDWVTWQTNDRYKLHLAALTSCLKTLSPSKDEPLTLGKPRRVFVNDSRDFPTLIMANDEIPVVLASAGIQRVVALAYILIWAWQEHLANSEIVRRQPQKSIVLMIDEIEAHLHPRWQRIIVPAVMEVVKQLSISVSPQLHIATHSPMVMTSVETVFNEEIDDLHHLKFDSGKVTLEELLFVKRGRADLWLMSDVFGLDYPRSLPAEQAINDAKSLQLSDNPIPEKVREVNSRLIELLAPDDNFWPRWRYFAEKYDS
jgi:AAA domain, putative AbiEii toxin, Type IV TA system